MHRPTGGYGRCFSWIQYYLAHLLGDDHDIIMSFDIQMDTNGTSNRASWTTRVFKKKVLLRNQPWKNKKRRRRVRSRDYRSQPNHIPLDLTLEILQDFLPNQSSGLLSSHFRVLSTPSSRSSSQLTRDGPHLLLTFEFHKKQLVFSFPQNQNPDGSYHMKNSYYDSYLR
ncbi:hypothetical protein IGI04_031939 [Brassica rapa subsp. trilocularis]|uniref:Uncharacterized protein n=1 Tax=Brassica rapa subsp. trilocularis TaxID=1813537 RepID=A0ABQ7LV12_BRACM|nr:hypothetical protein IGI04_031939 [Brassica rapa subsp. trilocularis]